MVLIFVVKRILLMAVIVEATSPIEEDSNYITHAPKKENGEDEGQSYFQKSGEGEYTDESNEEGTKSIPDGSDSSQNKDKTEPTDNQDNSEIDPDGSDLSHQTEPQTTSGSDNNGEASDPDGSDPSSQTPQTDEDYEGIKSDISYDVHSKNTSE